MQRVFLGPPSFHAALNPYEGSGSHTKGWIKGLTWLKTYHIFIYFFRSVFSQMIQLYRAEDWHKEIKEHLWLREGGISSLHSSSILSLAKSGYGGHVS